ncbi:MAG: aminotransferase class V-fold PLP-dependent enzyme [Marinilabiliaceae bacterium]|nr:aminotransferase class V-fold PLP-dependent enzyme [Marinilabiliaceae bacterium]
MKRFFASDNNAIVHPKVMAAIMEVNNGHTISYGDDVYTKETIELFKKEFETNEIDVFFVYNGTGANVVALQALTNPFNAVICAQTAHINVDECGAPEKQTCCKLIAMETPDGKLTTELIAKTLHAVGDQHHSQPRVVSITQSTEMGTLYSIEELKNICDFAHQNNLYVHLDGARIANAAAALNCNFADLTWKVGIDALSFGGTKNGLMFGEAVIFFDRSLAKNVPFIRKQSAQLHSKMRFISAQYKAYFENQLWRHNALHANKMAALLSEKVSKLSNIKLTQKVQVNSIFAIIPKEWIKPLQKESFFYVWDEENSEVRWMTAFDTSEEDIDSFVELISEYNAINILGNCDI